MAIATTPPIEFPAAVPRHRTTAISGLFASLTLDAAGERGAFIFRVPKTGTVTKVAFRLSFVVAGDLETRLETVDLSTGFPSGTLFGTNTNATSTFSTAGWKTVTLTAGASVTQGDLIAIVLVNVSGSQIVTNISAVTTPVQFPFSAINTGSWTVDAGAPVGALEYNDGSYAPIPYVFPYSAIDGVSIASNTTPDEAGIKFTLPFPARASGAYIYADTDGDCDIVLYDSDGTTPLLTKSLDKDVRSATSAGWRSILFDSTANLSAGVAYRLVVKPTTTTGVGLGRPNADSVAVMVAMPGGANTVWTERTDAGAWTDVTTQTALMGIVINGLDDGTGGGSSGMLVHPGMVGGARG